MAGTDRFMIAPITDGVHSDLKPWLIPDSAFQTLQNAYIFRGRIKKRFGSRLMQGTTTPTEGFEQLQSRLRILVNTTDGAGAANGNVPGVTYEIGQMFSVGDVIFTCYSLGFGPMFSTNFGIASGIYNTATGAYVFAGCVPGAPVYFYPAQPVMGLITYQQQAISDEKIVAFDTQFAYEYNAAGWSRLGTALWTGSNSDFFWGCTYRGTLSSNNFLFVTNYKFGTTGYTGSDLMRYYDGAAWQPFNPSFSSAAGGPYTILSSRIILPFKNRLILLNVVENTGGTPGGAAGTNAVHVNRCRFSKNGDPTNLTNSFDQYVPGLGGFVDAPTREAIVTAQFLKDRLIVYFESSTWELVYTSNQILPFVWQRINSELGAESTFSQVPFDKAVLGIGNVGIHACDAVSVERIDEKIPDMVFEIHNENDGIKRVAGIRDYFTQMVYWAIPGVDRSSDYPFNNRVLTYNYLNGSWAMNDDSITSFGYYQSASTKSNTWAQLTNTWGESTGTWGSAPLQAKFRSVLAGNQQGFVFIVDTDSSRNAPALQITDITNPSGGMAGTTLIITCQNHNLEPGFNGDGDYIIIENAIGSAGINGNIYPVQAVIDANNFTIISDYFGQYLGAGTISRVSNINITTKQYNFYVNKGVNFCINKVDFLVDKTTDGEITVDYNVSSSGLSMLQQATNSGSLTGTGVLETSPYALVPLEDSQDRLWHPVYMDAEGECIQLNIYFSADQLVDKKISMDSRFELHAMTFFSQVTSSRLQ